jgi:hypothetical protein
VHPFAAGAQAVATHLAAAGRAFGGVDQGVAGLQTGFEFDVGDLFGLGDFEALALDFAALALDATADEDPSFAKLELFGGKGFDIRAEAVAVFDFGDECCAGTIGILLLGRVAVVGQGRDASDKG